MCAGSDSLFIGSFDGYVSIIGKAWKVIKRFQAYEAGSITHMRQVEGTSLLLTVAVSLDALGQGYDLELWWRDTDGTTGGYEQRTCVEGVGA